MKPSWRESVLEAFGFLVTDFAFEVGFVQDDLREKSVTFKREDRYVVVQYEPFGPVCVTVGYAEPGQVSQNFGLWFLVCDAHPEEEARFNINAPVDSEALSAMLERQAQALRRSGADMLRGDFSRAARIKQLQAEAQRRRNVAAFGTTTGEAPRFSERPTLEQLFADATNDGIVDARCYQAVWDYHFEIEEIAAFLKETPADVQQRLARWEG